jgi:hypothetical protein
MDGHLPRRLATSQCVLKYGYSFWSDFFREIRSRKEAFSDVARLGDGRPLAEEDF